MRRSKNPLTHYLQYREWQWISADEVMKATGCTREELDHLCDHQNGVIYIERKGDRYRYIGTFSSEKRKVVELLRKIYPESVGNAQLSKQTGLNTYIGQLVGRYVDKLPIEIIGSGSNREYRYLPNDERSLTDMKPKKFLDACCTDNTVKMAIYNLLKKHPGTCYTPLEIVRKINVTSAHAVGIYIAKLRKEYPEIRIKRSHNGEHSTTYLYSPVEVSA